LFHRIRLTHIAREGRAVEGDAALSSYALGCIVIQDHKV
jgi:hypothetical protein